MTGPLVIVALWAVALIVLHEVERYRTGRHARSRFEAEIDALLDRPSAEIVPFFRPRLPPRPASRSRAAVPLPLPLAPRLRGQTPSRACVQERRAAADLGYLGPHRRVSRWVEPPLKDERAPESWHSDRGRAPTPGLETDGTEDIG